MILKGICSQLRSCGFECKGGSLENNVAFIELEKLAQLEEDTHNILAMSREEMARLWRFAPSGHPYFDRTNPASEIFEARFKELGGFSPEISKNIGLGGKS
jgi:hypothetical protein